MMFVFWILHLTVLAHAEPLFEKLINVGTFFESNTFYEDKRDVGDFYLGVKPEFNYDSRNKTGFNIQTYLNANYQKYVSHSNLDLFELETFIKLSKRNVYGTNYFITSKYLTRAEPPASQTADRLVRTYMGGDGGFGLHIDDLHSLEFIGNYVQETTNVALYDYQHNYEYGVNVKHTFSFLPETAIISEIKYGQKIFPEGTKNENDINLGELVKYDTQYVEVGSGVYGRLTRNMKIKSYAGLLIRQYAKEVGFNEPVFNIEFEEERSPRDMILLGYDYRVEDSFYANYVLKQTMHIGFGRIFGDQLLALVRLMYQYRSYSRPGRREDQRVGGEFKLDYSFSNVFKAEAVLHADFLTSESLARGSANTADPSVSYEFLRAGLLLKYLF